ncbi:type I restriction-modification system subunit M [Neptuniibacter sp. PT34_22]|uniref:type I restriction-modification system subunit M n=1 Tax=Neptuniibacter sp. PT34_22 TaxID=3398205 RepID=UPI0039F56741
MVEQHKKALEKQLWNIANALRSNMSADEFRDYILGFIFYKYLSERLDIYADELLKEDGIKFDSIDEDTDEGREYLEAIKEEAIDHLGYFLKPSELFHVLAQKGKSGEFILEALSEVLNHIEQSTMGTASEDDFNGLFDDLDLTSNKLGKTEKAKNELISKILVHLDDINFLHQETEIDVLGDAYEYLIGQFASGAGKKAGEFYTPPMVSKLLAKLVTIGKDKLKSVYDPTCGSGSLLLRVAKEVKEVGNYYGQESNPSTYNLARMNMILHGVHYRQFDIQQDDTLEEPHHIEKRFEAVVANPPFSADWSASAGFLSDERFQDYGKLAPKGKADFAFVQHMLHQLDENGTIAVVLPHGTLFRPAAEAHIRKHIIGRENLLDAVIGLPGNIFYGTDSQTCVLVFKKNRTSKDVCFIDAKNEFLPGVNKDSLTDDGLRKIMKAYVNRQNIEKFCSVVTTDYIEKEHKFNLNITRYVDSFEPQEKIDIKRALTNRNIVCKLIVESEEKLREYSRSLGFKWVGSDYYDLNNISHFFDKRLRFQDAKSPFPEWEEKRFGEVFERIRTKNKIGNKNVLTISAQHGLINQEKYFNKSVSSKDLSGYFLLSKGEFAYNKSYSKGYPLGAIKRLNNYDSGVVSPLYICFKTRASNESGFWQQYFEAGLVNHEIYKIAQEGARNHGLLNVSVTDFFEDIKIKCPHYKEQIAISNYLTEYDNYLELKSKLLLSSVTVKKGLVQNILEH